MSRTCVILVGYIGSAYHGSQLQSHQLIATVKSKLFDAVVALITPYIPSTSPPPPPPSDLASSDRESSAALLVDLQRQVSDRMTTSHSKTNRINRRTHKRLIAIQKALTTNDTTALLTFATEYRRQSHISS